MHCTYIPGKRQALSDVLCSCNLSKTHQKLYLSLAVCEVGALAALEESQTMLTNLGQALAKAPPMQLAATYVMVPREFMRSAVQDAVKYQINQLAYADKVQGLTLRWLHAGPAGGS